MNIGLIINIGVIALIVGAIAYLWFTGKKVQAKKIILFLVQEAEEKFGPQTGGEKYRYVISKLWDKLPKVIKIFVTEDELDQWIEDCVELLKKELKKP